LSDSGQTAQALRYVIKRRTALTRFATDARLEADNNIAENAIRCIAVEGHTGTRGEIAGTERALVEDTLVGRRHGNDTGDLLGLGCPAQDRVDMRMWPPAPAIPCAAASPIVGPSEATAVRAPAVLRISRRLCCLSVIGFSLPLVLHRHFPMVGVMTPMVGLLPFPGDKI
jgi:Transposase IS66 family